AEDGIRDPLVTGVQTCALPIFIRLDGRLGWRSNAGKLEFFTQQLAFTGRGGARFDPTDFRLVLDAATAAQPASGQIEFSNLQLEIGRASCRERVEVAVSGVERK